MTAPEMKFAVFSQFAREGVRWHFVGGLAKPDVMDSLRDIGIEAGLLDDEIQVAPVAAVDNPFDPAAARKANGSGEAPDGVRRPIDAEGSFDGSDGGGEPTGKITQRDKLVLVADRASLWRCSEGVAHASVQNAGRTEHYKIRSRGFRDWLLREAGASFPITIAGRQRPGTFGKNAIEEALCCCEAIASASGAIHPAPLRVAADEAAIYLDLGGPNWDAVEIALGSWRTVPSAGVPILRTRRTRALPRPRSGGSLEPLRQLLPVKDEDEFRLVVLWILAALRPVGPYPILALSGEQGSGKSLTARMLRELVDPHGDNIMQPPRNDRDLIAAAKGNHVLAFDNLSTMPGDLADSICRLATGGDIGGRMLYTDADSAAFAAQRPIIVNGIPDLVTRGDLASRAIFVRLMPMKHRRTEADLRGAFDAAAPEILGTILDAFAGALKVLPELTLPDDGAAFRMADFALLAMAAEGPLGWPAGSALNALRRNAKGATAMMVDLDPIALAIRGLVERSGGYSGLVSGLHARLTEVTDLETRRAPGWPKDAARLGERLRRVAPALRASGITINETRTRSGMTVSIARSGESQAEGAPRDDGTERDF